MKNLTNILKNKQVKDIAIWCGAGISINSPCCLPSGYELSDQIFYEFMEYHSSILTIWKNCNKIIQKYTNTHDGIRPEVMVSCINRIKYAKTTKEFYRRFGKLERVHHNYNHYLLSLFVEAGGIVYTTNFDMCIEHAFESIFQKPLQKEQLCNGKVVAFFSEKDGAIYHVHGTFEYGEEAGASIENVMTGFDREMLDQMENSFIRQINIFAGYSFSDDYDLNNLFRRCGTNGSNIFVCNHRGLDQILTYKVKEICGKGTIMIEKDTTDLFRQILENLQISYLTESKMAGPQIVEWRHFLSYPNGYNVQYKLLYTVELINQFHISYKKIDKDIFGAFLKLVPEIMSEVAEKEKENTEQETAKAIDTILYNLIANSAYWVGGKSLILKGDFLKRALKNRFNNNLFLLQSNAKRQRLREHLLQIEQKLKNGEKLSNEDHEVIATYMRIQTVCQILGGTMKTQNLLEGVNSHTCNLEYSQGEEVYMFAARLRYKYLLTHQEEDWKEAVRIYYDVGNIEGVISSLIAKAVVGSIVTNRRISHIEEWKDAFILIRETGNNKYKRKCNFLWLADGLKHIPIVGAKICKSVFSISEKLYS